MDQPPQLLLDLPDAELIRAELRALREEIAVRKPRTVEERLDLQRRTVRLFDRLLASFVGQPRIPDQPGCPEYKTRRWGELKTQFLSACGLMVRNCRVDLLSRAASLVWPEPMTVRRWIDTATLHGTVAASPYAAAMHSEDGLAAALEVLEVLFEAKVASSGEPLREGARKDDFF